MKIFSYLFTKCETEDDGSVKPKFEAALGYRKMPFKSQGKYWEKEKIR